MPASPQPLPYWRLSSFYFWYYAALGGYTPFFAQWLHDQGQSASAISALLALWYATRVAAPTAWSALSGRSPHPIRWLRSARAHGRSSARSTASASAPATARSRSW